MDQIGRITEVTPEGYAKVYIERNKACEKCGICHMGETQGLQLTVRNIINAQPGNRVLVNLHGADVIAAGAIVYIAPIVALLAGLGGGYFLAVNLSLVNPDLWGIGLGFLAMALIYIAIRAMEPRFRKSENFRPELVRVVDEFEGLDEDPCGTR
jgi:positive regulator of sigma E activity